ncbi:MAG: hypothetical protein V4457_07520 [Pseudomonadota bacterium]|jgi:hypothetical protein
MAPEEMPTRIFPDHGIGKKSGTTAVGGGFAVSGDPSLIMVPFNRPRHGTGLFQVPVL